jgi:hypothetical protein
LQAAYVSQNTHRNTLLKHTLLCFIPDEFTSITYPATLKSGDDERHEIMGPLKRVLNNLSLSAWACLTGSMICSILQETETLEFFAESELEPITEMIELAETSESI